MSTAPTINNRTFWLAASELHSEFTVVRPYWTDTQPCTYMTDGEILQYFGHDALEAVHHNEALKQTSAPI